MIQLSVFLPSFETRYPQTPPQLGSVSPTGLLVKCPQAALEGEDELSFSLFLGRWLAVFRRKCKKENKTQKGYLPALYRVT